jgi:hypothetical protein
MADHYDFTTQNFHKQLPIALSKVKPSTCRKLIAKLVEQEEKYWVEDEQLYEPDFDEISDDEECATIKNRITRLSSFFFLTFYINL